MQQEPLRETEHGTAGLFAAHACLCSTDGKQWSVLVLESAKEGSLADNMSDIRQEEQGVKTAYMRRMAECVAALHKLRVIWCDAKPPNFLLFKLSPKV